MDVSCPACAARYTADDEKLRGKTARMRCKACNTLWLVTGPGASSAVTQGISTPPPAAVIPASLAEVSVPSKGDVRVGQAAVVKKGSAREKRDLFADRESSRAVDPEAPEAPPPTVGARADSSVLFRVDQLATTAGRVKTPEPERSPLVADDEGIIDLKALATATPSVRPVGPLVPPLFSEPPPVTLEVDGSRHGTRPRSKLRLVGGFAAAAAFLVVAGYGISVAFKGEEPVKREPIVAVTPPPPAVTPPPKVDPPPPATDDKDDAKTKKASRGGGRGRPHGPAPHAPASKPKAADMCGCHGDFNCIIACAAKK